MTDQPVGPPVPDWTARPDPAVARLEGRWVRLERLGPAHAAAFHEEACGPEHAALWTYLFDEPPLTRADTEAYVAGRAARAGLSTLAVVPTTGRAAGRTAGLASWLRLDAANGSVEVGGIVLGPALQRTTAATEAMWLMARHVFALGYRRYEWKCDALNAPSRAAATRLGFRYEGTFRQAVVCKGRSRDTAWFAMTDGDWALLAPAYDAWLDPGCFADPERGLGQRRSLSGPHRRGPRRRALTRCGTAFSRVETTVTLA